MYWVLFDNTTCKLHQERERERGRKERGRKKKRKTKGREREVEARGGKEGRGKKSEGREGCVGYEKVKLRKKVTEKELLKKS